MPPESQSPTSSEAEPESTGDVADVASLAVSAQNGSATALNELLARFRPYLLKIANEELPRELQPKLGESDLVQETLMMAGANIQSFAGKTEAEFLAWLRRILLNRLLNVIREYKAGKRRVDREQPMEGIEPCVDGGSPSSGLIAQEEQDLLALAMAGLSARHRQVLQLRSEQGYSFVQIGQTMQCSESAARKLWARAVVALKEELDERP